MMRSAALSCLLVIALSLLPRVAQADPLDQFSITTASLDIELSLPASVTVVNASPAQYTSPLIQGTVNGTPYEISAHFIFTGNCSVCDTLFVTGTPVDPTAGPSLNDEYGLPNLYQFGPYTFPPGPTFTVNFLPGVYPTDLLLPPSGFEPATITVTSEAAAITPEPSSLCLVGTAALASLGLLRRRLIR